MLAGSFLLTNQYFDYFMKLGVIVFLNFSFWKEAYLDLLKIITSYFSLIKTHQRRGSPLSCNQGSYYEIEITWNYIHIFVKAFVMVHGWLAWHTKWSTPYMESSSFLVFKTEISNLQKSEHMLTGERYCWFFIFFTYCSG